MVINLRKARKFFACLDKNKFFWTICLPFGFKVTRKALVYLKSRKIKLVSDKRVKEPYANGDPKEFTIEGDKGSYTLTAGYIGHE